MASLDHLSRLGVTGSVPSCLVPGPGGLGQADSAMEYGNLTKEVAGGVGLGLVGLHVKVNCRLGELLTISRN